MLHKCCCNHHCHWDWSVTPWWCKALIWLFYLLSSLPFNFFICFTESDGDKTASTVTQPAVVNVDPSGGLLAPAAAISAVTAVPVLVDSEDLSEAGVISSSKGMPSAGCLCMMENGSYMRANAGKLAKFFYTTRNRVLRTITCIRFVSSISSANVTLCIDLLTIVVNILWIKQTHMPVFMWHLLSNSSISDTSLSCWRDSPYSSWIKNKVG